MKFAVVFALLTVNAIAEQKTAPKTVTFSSYVADNFKILSKVKKEKPQVAFQDTSGWRMPASDSKDATKSGTSAGAGSGANGGTNGGGQYQVNDKVLGFGTAAVGPTWSLPANANAPAASPAATPDSSATPSSSGNSP